MAKTNFPTSAVRQKFLEYNAARNAEARRYKNFENDLKYVRRLKALSPELKLLDIGCGPGTFTAFWMDKGVQGHGMDRDFSLVKAAKQRSDEKGMKGRFVVGRVEELPYRDGLFDVCFANALLEHVQDWQATLGEVTRVLKDDGLLVFCTTNKLHPFQQEINHFPFYPWIPGRIKKRILEKIMQRRPDLVNYTEYPAIHWFSYENLKAFLYGLGYKVCTRLDMIEKSDLTGWKTAAKSTLSIIQTIHWLRYLYYFYSKDVSVYAIKSGARTEKKR